MSKITQNFPSTLPLFDGNRQAQSATSIAKVGNVDDNTSRLQNVNIPFFDHLKQDLNINLDDGSANSQAVLTVIANTVEAAKKDPVVGKLLSADTPEWTKADRQKYENFISTHISEGLQAYPQFRGNRNLVERQAADNITPVTNTEINFAKLTENDVYACFQSSVIEVLALQRVEDQLARENYLFRSADRELNNYKQATDYYYTRGLSDHGSGRHVEHAWIMGMAGGIEGTSVSGSPYMPYPEGYNFSDYIAGKPLVDNRFDRVLHNLSNDSSKHEGMRGTRMAALEAYTGTSTTSDKNLQDALHTYNAKGTDNAFDLARAYNNQLKSQGPQSSAVENAVVSGAATQGAQQTDNKPPSQQPVSTQQNTTTDTQSSDGTIPFGEPLPVKKPALPVESEAELEAIRQQNQQQTEKPATPFVKKEGQLVRAELEKIYTPDVQEVQNHLVALKLLETKDATGYFDEKTAAALETFQKNEFGQCMYKKDGMVADISTRFCLQEKAMNALGAAPFEAVPASLAIHDIAPQSLPQVQTEQRSNQRV